MYTPTEDDLSARIGRLRRVEPRPALEPRVLAAMAESASGDRAGVRSVPAGRVGLDRSALASGLAAAASIAALFVVLAVRTHGDLRSGPAAAVGPAALAASPVVGLAPERRGAGSGGAARDVEPLMEASWLLERALGTLPAPRRVMRADTASTIVSLETRIAAIDAALGAGPGGTADGPDREALWRDRINVMAALYQVRYAQSRTFDF